MSSSLVIVALPAEDELVWKISSEKVPHLTVLYLGETTENRNVNSMVAFVQHALEVSKHGPFYLEVDYRGVLGDDQADVLFFDQGWDCKWIKQLRSQLLQQPDIRKAYEEAQQFPEWNPHLTLGYPKAPAKPLDDNQGFFSIKFDRIAIWTGNHEGPEFRLKWLDREEGGDLAVAYADTGKAAVEEMLEHVGVKGMKWGVRKAAGAYRKSVVKARDKAFEAGAGTQDTRNKISIHASSNFKKQDLPAINAKPEYVKAKKLPNRLLNPRDPVVKQYRKEHKEAYIQQLEKSANSMTNASKTREYTIRERGIELPARGGALPKSKYNWVVSTRPIKGAAQHSDDFDGETIIDVILDKDGFIIDVVPQVKTLELAQTAEQGEVLVGTILAAERTTVQHGAIFTEALVHSTSPAEIGEAFLEDLFHIGVKGMRWGHRKSRDAPAAVAPTATSVVPRGSRRKTKVKVEGGENHVAAPDAIKVAQSRAKLKKSGPAALSNKELQEIANRVELEARVNRATQSSGRKFIRDLTGRNKEINESIGTGLQTARLVNQTRALA